MEVQHVNVKFFAADSRALDLAGFIGIFNEWIRERVGGELLVDVADYRHVSAGPGVMLIGHQANYSMDETGDRLGLLYNRKAPMNGDTGRRLAQAVRSALTACRRLEQEPLLDGRLKFIGSEFEMLLNDRLLAPNTEETFAAFEPDLRTLCSRLYPSAVYTVQQNTDLRERFGVRVKAVGSFTALDLLRNLES
ncbi:MAG: hypothetical protein HY315_06500 [Acidobacteria bacterium]|nr:hypothetical protein [Acidobacteriota bacterium]